MKNFIPQKVHFVGIGGIGMSGLAQHLLRTGHDVSGSDKQENSQTEKLRTLGAVVNVPHGTDVCGAQLVVRTSAVPFDNPEVAFAHAHGIPVVLREELLGTIFNEFETRIAVCGTHGKTTVTAMVHHVLERCGVDHAAFIGGEFCGENYFYGSGVAVAEACEYNQSFLHLNPTVCLCLNVEYDHPDCYKNKQDVEHAFQLLFERSKTVILPSHQQTLWRTSALFGESGVVARNVRLIKGCASFDVTVDGMPVGKCKLLVCGRHNVQNALAAIAVANQLGLPMLQVLQALSTFQGVDRRWSKAQSCLNVVCDYAHHPTEIQATVQAAQNVCTGRIVAVFQPHTFSRTQAFFKDFVGCFAGVDEILYLPIYSAREKAIKGVTSFGLYKLAKAQGKNAKYFADFQSAANYLKKTAARDDLILLLGAGDVNKMAQLL